jgi:hypothetical protein
LQPGFTLRTSSEHTPACARWDETLDRYGTGSKPLNRTANPEPNRIGTRHFFLNTASANKMFEKTAQLPPKNRSFDLIQQK